MNKRDFCFKFKWWAKEHCLFYHSHLGNEIELQYTLPSEYRDFAVHPCVRYVKEGIGGYKWWMVLSPYEDYDIKKENILLFRGKNNQNGNPPEIWEFVKEVCGTHKNGFNSDPNLYYDGKDLWIIWREWETENLPMGVPLACIMCSKTNDGINFSPHKVIAHNEFNEYTIKGDTVMCPIVITYKGEESLYASYYVYEPFLQPIGVSRYLNDKGFFKLNGFHHKYNLWFDLWHFDLFELDGFLYQIITGQFGNAIYIGRSKDGKTFEYSRRPLYSYPWFVKKNYFYKPSAQVFNGNVYVFFPRKKKHGTVRIVMRSINISDIRNYKYE